MKQFIPHSVPRRALALLAFIALTVPGIAHAGGGPTGAGGANIILVQSRHFQVALPPTVQAGAVTIRWVDNGGIWSGASLALLKPGVTAARFAAVEKTGNGEAAMALAVPYGGVGGPADRRLIVNLAPGQYVIFDQENGANHSNLVAAKSFLVTGAATGPLAGPSASANVSMVEFKFNMPRNLSAGLNVLRIQNAGQQDHMMILYKANPGVTYQQVLNTLKNSGPNGPSGPPPGYFAGGVDTMSPGQTSYLVMNFKPGLYIAICFDTDPKTHKPHFLLGMVHPIYVA